MKPILHKFRSAAFGGFNRKDVLDYLELSARESEGKIQTLQQQLETVQREKTELAASLASLRSESSDLVEQEARVRASLEKSSHSLTLVRGELQTTRTQLAVAKKELSDLQSKVAQIEPLAARYEALKDRVATVELEAHQKAQTTLDQARGEVESLRTDTAQWMGEVRKHYDSLRSRVRENAEVAVHAEEAFQKLETEYQQLLCCGLGMEDENS